MNWGKGITIAVILFIGFIASFVYKAFQTDRELVREDYYEYETSFDDNKEGKQNYALSHSKVLVDQREEGICIEFPEDLGSDASGHIFFYRPDQKKYDRDFELELDANHKQVLAYEHFREGYYDIRIEWASGEKQYVFEDDIQF